MPLSMVDGLLAISNCGCKSLAANSFVMTKIEMLKLTCGKDKCKQIHIGKEERGCPTLKVHGEDMKKVNQEKYLGDIIGEILVSRNGSNQKILMLEKAKEME